MLEPLRGYGSVANLIALADSDPEPDEMQAALGAVLDEDYTRNRSAPFLPKWLKEIITTLASDSKLRIKTLIPPAGLF